MFERLELINFQCHKKLILNLDRITTFVGPSDSGKTAILRAIDWVCFNQGRTSLLTRRGADFVTVALFADGHRIIRSTKKNSYCIDDQVLSTIGRKIPPEITSFFRMTDDNVQRQHDYLYWFSANGAALVSNLNRVVDLSRLEDWMRTGIAKEKHSKDRIATLQEREEELNAEHQLLQPYRNVDTELVNLERDQAILEEAQSRFTALTDILCTLNAISVKAQRIKTYIADLSALTTAVENYTNTAYDLQAISTQLDSLRRANLKIQAYTDLLSNVPDDAHLRETAERLSGIQGLLQQLRSIDIKTKTKFIADLTALLDLHSTLSATIQRREALDDLLAVYSVRLPSASTAQQALDTLHNSCERAVHLKNILDSLENLTLNTELAKTTLSTLKTELNEQTEGICPICGGALHPEDTDE